MNEIQIFNNPDFGQIRVIEIDGEPWMVGKDVAEALGYSNTKDALLNHVDEEDRRILQRSEIATIENHIPKTALPVNFVSADIPNRGLTIINESGLYSLVLSSKLPSAKKFRRWVTSEVLPSIRKTGGYNIPKDYPSALRALADAEEKRIALESENAAQRQAIADFEPIKQYVDTILSSNRTLTTTQIAADYDMSAKRLNRILFDEGIQRHVNGQWILYAKHMGKGYTKSKTINITRSDGRPDTVLNTEWTQKGRLKIHEILTARGILALMDRGAA